MVDKVGDPFLNYFALGLLVFVVVAIFYGIIAIHDIPARIARNRHHPHEDAIHAAGWVSLFTLHVLWPFLWIWAMAYQPERGWGFSGTHHAPPNSPNELDDLRRRIAELEKKQDERWSVIMELLLVAIYVAICMAVFKLFRIPVNQWSLSTSVLIGIIGIFLLLLGMSYNHPFTTNARIYYAVTPILPTVKGRVIEVPVELNTPLKEGDALFRIDPKPYQYVVDQKKAALTEAEQKVDQLREALNKASAEVERVNAQRQLAQDNYDRQDYLFQRNAAPKAALDTATRNLDVAKQSLVAVKAEEESARTAYTSNVDGVNTLVAKARAELADAQFDLDQTTVRAAGPGFVTQVSLRPGMYVIPTQLRTAMLFINTGQRDRQLAAAFQQNSLQRVHAGDDAEVAFEAVPGRVFKAKVRSVVDAIAAGELISSPVLVEPGQRTTAGRAVAIIDVSDDMHEYQIPLGSTAQVAIYTEHLHDLSLLRKILLRMKSWQNYVFLEEGH